MSQGVHLFWTVKVRHYKTLEVRHYKTLQPIAAAIPATENFSEIDLSCEGTKAFSRILGQGSVERGLQT